MSRAAPYLLLGGGAITAGASAVYWLWWAPAARKSEAISASVAKAIAGTDGPPKVDESGQMSGGGKVYAKFTTYWPFVARDDEKKMEGGKKDRIGKPLQTLEDFLDGKVAWVSLSGDPTLWPFGSRVDFPYNGKTVTGRVVDMGDNFTGTRKKFRQALSSGSEWAEPLDICVRDRETKPPKGAVLVQLFPGDDLQHMTKKTVKEIAYDKFRQTVTGDGDSPRTPDDYESLARAIESELGGRPESEQSAAAWAIRNRADSAGTSVYQLLAPRGTYGGASDTGGHASTRRAPTDQARKVARAVLDSSPAQDPTRGAIDFWVPSQQIKLRQLGDVYRAAAKSGDAAKAKKYLRYAGYGSEGDVRVQQAKDGLRVVSVVGAVELLGKV